MAVPLTLFLSFVSLDDKWEVVLVQDLKQRLMSLDLGFSSIENISKLDDTKSSKLTSLIKSVPEIIKYKIKNNATFDRIDIDINFLDYERILHDRKNAVSLGILSLPSTVNARIKYKNSVYKVRVRLKGDLSGHWTSSRRMSLRVHVKDKKSIFGFNKFSLHKPRERSYPHDNIFQSLIKKSGGLSNSHKLAHVFVNGDDWGIMDMEEHVSSRGFIEKQKKRESVIVRFSNEDLWVYNWKSKNRYTLYRLSDSNIFLNLYNKKTISKEKRDMYSYIADKRINKDLRLYDIDSHAMSYILASIWGNWHTLADYNSKYYFNPYTLLLEPITADQLYYQDIDSNTVPLVKSYIDITSTKYYLDNLEKYLNRVKFSLDFFKKDLDYWANMFPVDKKISKKLILNNLEKITHNKEYYLIKLPKTYANIKNPASKNIALPTKKQASEFKKHLHIRHYMDGTLELYNLLPDSVTVKDILFNGQSTSIRGTVVPSYLSHPKPVVIKTGYKGVQDGMFTVNTEYQGFNRDVKNDITLVSNGIDNPLLLDTINEFDFINKLDNNTFEIKRGSWTVNKPIIVNGDLHISPGVNLQFSKDAYINVKGSLTAIGGEANPIILKAISDSWKGIYVLNANKKSHLKNVNISNLSALEDELLKLTGGITFYKSDVFLENVNINNVKAEDAINIVESKFALNSVYVNNTVSDGLDSDFSKGSVSNSQFSNIGGDALDFSGSNVLIETTIANSVRDKAVSAGEESELTIKGSEFNNVGVGVASKDGSLVVMSGTTISNYELYGAMTYLKKDFYDAPSLIIKNSSVSDGYSYIRQKGTSMTVDGVNIPESKISVKKLYKTKVMTK